MKRLTVIPWLPMALAATIVAGCASEPAAPTVADRMRGHAADMQQEADLKSALAQQWERGRELAAAGNRKIEEGERRMRAAERDMEKAREQVRSGRSELKEGQKLVEEAEQRFRREFPGLDLN